MESNTNLNITREPLEQQSQGRTGNWEGQSLKDNVVSAGQNIASKTQELASQAGNAIENTFPTATREVKQLGRDMQAAGQEALGTDNEWSKRSASDTEAQSQTESVNKTTPASLSTPNVSTLPLLQARSKSPIQSQGFHISTAELPVDVHPETDVGSPSQIMGAVRMEPPITEAYQSPVFRKGKQGPKVLGMASQTIGSENEFHIGTSDLPVEVRPEPDTGSPSQIMGAVRLESPITENFDSPIYPKSWPRGNIVETGAADEKFHIGTDGLPVEINPVPDLATGPEDTEAMHQSDVDADSLPSAIKALQAGVHTKDLKEGKIHSHHHARRRSSKGIAAKAGDLADKAGEVGSTLKEGVTEVANTATEGTQPVPALPLEKVGEVVVASAAVLASGMSNFTHKVAERLPGWRQSAQETVETVREAVPQVIETASNAAYRAKDLAMEGVERVEEAIPVMKNAAIHSVEVIREKAHEVMVTVQETLGQVEERVVEVTTNVKDTVTSVAAPALETVANAGTRAKDAVVSAGITVAETASTVGGKAKDTLSTAGQSIADTTVRAKDAVVTAGSQAAQSVSNAGQKVKETVVSTANKTSDVAHQTVEPLGASATNLDREKAHKAIPLYRTDEEIRAEQETLGNKLAAAANAVKETAIHAVEVVRGKTANATEAVEDTANETVEKAKNLLPEKKPETTGTQLSAEDKVLRSIKDTGVTMSPNSAFQQVTRNVEKKGDLTKIEEHKETIIKNEQPDVPMLQPKSNDVQFGHTSVSATPGLAALMSAGQPVSPKPDPQRPN